MARQAKQRISDIVLDELLAGRIRGRRFGVGTCWVRCRRRSRSGRWPRRWRSTWGVRRRFRRGTSGTVTTGSGY